MTDDQLRLRVTHIRPELGPASRPDAISYFLEPIDGRPVSYRPGQFLTLILPHPAGNQHSPAVRRSYSLSSLPGEPLRLTIKRVSNGELSRYLLDTLRVGDTLTSLWPAGRFVLDETAVGDVVLLGAGSGITPLFGLLKQILLTDTSRRVTLLYSNTNEQRIIFRGELASLQEQYPARFRLIHLLSQPADKLVSPGGSVRIGRLNNVMLDRLLPELIGPSDPSAVQFYVCGPADYMRMVQFTLTFNGIKPEQVRRENFVAGPVAVAPPPLLAVDRVVMLRTGARETTIRVAAYKSILQAALDEGIALPYSCRGGRCSTCAARCVSGRVLMTINDVLTERDLSDGWVLTCTGYPESDNVVLVL